jgi:hypothetical protein
MTKSELLAHCNQILKEDAWAEMPGYPREDWRRAASDGDTQLGYWDWVKHVIESTEDVWSLLLITVDGRSRIQLFSTGDQAVAAAVQEAVDRGHDRATCYENISDAWSYEEEDLSLQVFFTTIPVRFRSEEIQLGPGQLATLLNEASHAAFGRKNRLKEAMLELEPRKDANDTKPDERDDSDIAM